MKKYFNYTQSALKKILIISSLIIIVCLGYSFINPPFILSFANSTFIIGVVLVCLSLINGFRNDHKLFKAYTKEVASGNDMSIDQYKKENVNPTLSVFSSVSIIILFIGIIVSLIA